MHDLPTPNRETTWRIIVGMALTANQANRLLHAGGHSPMTSSEKSLLIQIRTETDPTARESFVMIAIKAIEQYGEATQASLKRVETDLSHLRSEPSSPDQVLEEVLPIREGMLDIQQHS
jgi:hypothetical protein